jgi:hypothetical protein
VLAHGGLHSVSTRNDQIPEVLDIPAAVVVLVDQFLELLEVVRARAVEAHHALELRLHRGLQPLEVAARRLFLLEALRQLLEVDLREVDRAVDAVLFLDLERLGADRAVEELVDPLDDVRDVRRIAAVADEVGERADRAAALRELTAIASGSRLHKVHRPTAPGREIPSPPRAGSRLAASSTACARSNFSADVPSILARFTPCALQ